MIQTLTSRSNNNDLIEKAFIDKILKEETRKFDKVQQRALRAAPDDPRLGLIQSSRSFNVSNETMTHRHNIQQRFIDMKRTRYGRQKPIKVHNTNLYRHFNNIIFRVKTNLTDAVRAQIAKENNIQIYG